MYGILNQMTLNQGRGAAVTELDAARMKIDEADAAMAQLFCARMRAVEEVAAYKKEHGLPVLDASREEAVVAKNLARLSEADAGELGALYEDFIRHTMALSRARQKALLARDAVAYQGVKGAFSHIALKRLYPHAKAVAFATWRDAVEAVSDGRVEAAVLPFENSNAGDVSAVLDLCYAHEELFVSRVCDLPVSQNLLGMPGAALAGVKKVVSHPQALAQCAKFLRMLGVETAEYPNTAAAAKYVRDTGDASLAAIASPETAALYRLEILAPDIAETSDNTTRFIVVTREKPTSGSRFSLLFTVEHAAGMLARVIRIIGDFGFNMESIKSRPMPHVPWEYYFYTELVGQPSDGLLTALQDVCKTVRVLGVYDRE